MQPARIRAAYVVSLAIAVALTFVLHEAAHWTTGNVLGNDMAMNLNAAWPVSGEYRQPWHGAVVSAAGPLFTLLQAVLIWFLMRRERALISNSKWILWYPLLLSALVMRLLAAGMNAIRPQDEGRISLELGLGVYSLPLLICAVLFALTYWTSRRYQLSTRFNAISVVLVILFSSVLILGNQWWAAQ